MTIPAATVEEVRGFFATLMAAASGSTDPRLRRAFEAVPREDFMGPGPWRIVAGGVYCETPSADPRYLYQNALVALDETKGINNGEPYLHAGWIAAADPRPGEHICHIGAGTGYYTAILALLASPGGQVTGFEVEPSLVVRAQANLRPYQGVTVVAGDATVLPLPGSDLIYVNAGVVMPPPSWLRALRPGGRLIFPWRPSDRAGLAMLLTRTNAGFAARPLMSSWFIPCIGASDPFGCTRVPDVAEAWAARSAWLVSDRPPDGSAVAIGQEVWFSDAPPER